MKMMNRGVIYSIKPFLKHRSIFLRNVISTYASAPCTVFEERKNSVYITVGKKKSIEAHWRNKINLHSYNTEDSTKEKYYILSMFPYPSGALHMGHVRVYTISDVFARFHRMKGKNVLHPMGWDAFGLPAENAAIENQIDPGDWTMQNIETMKEQLQTLNYSFDWDREFTTCDPKYYKWTQELFIKLFEKGLVYQKEEFVNWDPVDQTVLAEEQVNEDRCSWRSGAKVEKKLLNQWFIRTIPYAKSLSEELENPMLKKWRDIIKIQKNWIGDCNGISFEFELISDIPGYPKNINLWTTTPEFIEHAKFVAVAPNSILHHTEHCERVTDTIQLLKAKVLNPFTKKELPIFVTDKVDFPQFRDVYLGIPAVSMKDIEFTESVGISFDRPNINSHEVEEKLSEVTNLAKEWKIGGYPVSSRLKDWLISRQRYWGTPIPIIHCKECGAQPVPHDQLPVTLPKINRSFNKTITLHDVKDWLETSCPKCGGHATREADTMDTFVDSSWYFLRFIDPKNTNEMFSTEKVNKLFPVDLYIGGKEHAVLHLYYARFMSHFLYSEGLIPSREPFQQLLVHGMIMGQTFKEQVTGEYLRPDQVTKIENSYIRKDTLNEVKVVWEKMSKSKYNGVNPLDLIEKYGIDATRLLILSDIPPTTHRNWSEDTITGINNWQHRLWSIIEEFTGNRSKQTIQQIKEEPQDPKFAKDEAYMFDSRNYFLIQVSQLINNAQLNTAIARSIGLTNSLFKVSIECKMKSREFERALAAQIIMLAPFAPHFASELWAKFCSIPNHLIDSTEVNLDKDVLDQNWPQVDEDYKVSMPVYINEKQTAKIQIPQSELEELTVEKALQLVTENSKCQPLLKNYDVANIIPHLQKKD